MKKIIYTALLCFTISQFAFAQNVGIGTTNPSQLLHIKDGNLYVENAEIRLDNFGSKLARLGANLQVGAQANLYLNPGVNYSVLIRQGNTEYARFRGSTQRFGMGTLDPVEKIDINGAIKIGAAENANAGTIQWTGTDVQAHDGISWKSLIIPSAMKDADGDTEIVMTEGAQDEIKLRVDNKDIMKTTVWADGSHYIDWFGDTGAGAFQKVQHRFYNNGIITGVVGVANSSGQELSLIGDDKVTILGEYNGGLANTVYLQTGKFFSTYGVGISGGGSVSGSLRALLDVRGSFECDGAEINEGATIHDIMHLVPMPEPASPSPGDVYMDDGSCPGCSPGKTVLRYYNGSGWISL